MHEGDIMGSRAPSMSRRNLLFGATLLGAAGLARAMVPHERYDLLGKGKLDELIPNQIGPWQFVSKSGLVLPPEDSMVAALYSQLLTRTYVSDDRPPVMLLIAQSAGQDGVLQVHRPEFCYPASGYRLSDSRVQLIETPDDHRIPARAMTATRASRIEQLLYWTRIGRTLPTTWADQRLAVAGANLRGEIPDAVMVRISTLSPDPAAISEAVEFARLLVGSLPAKSRPVLAGNAA